MDQELEGGLLGGSEGVATYWVALKVCEDYGVSHEVAIMILLRLHHLRLD